MKIAYKSNDGCFFDNQEDCINRDNYHKDILEVLKPFSDNIESGGYVKRTSAEISNFIDDVYEILVKYHPEPSEIPDLWKKNPRGIVGRYFDDGNYPASRAYYLLISIDKRNRQWQQPYYAIQSDKNEAL